MLNTILSIVYTPILLETHYALLTCFLVNASVISRWTLGMTGACVLYSIENSPVH